MNNGDQSSLGVEFVVDAAFFGSAVFVDSAVFPSDFHIAGLGRARVSSWDLCLTLPGQQGSGSGLH